MALDLKSPLIVFDLETTGTSIIHDRIVEISMLKILPDGQETSVTHLINPGVPIPAEVTAIHGISDDKVKDCPTFKQLAKNLETFFKGADIAGFNVLKFDIPILAEEFLRVDINFDVSKKKIIDAQKLFHLMEKRTLGAAYKFYCGKDLENAHSAEADTNATWEVLKAQVERYQGNDVIDNKGNILGRINPDLQELHNITSGNLVDFAGRIVYNDNMEEVFNFGKHKGKKVTDVFKSEPQYYDWIIKSDFALDTKRKLTQIRLKSGN